MTWARPITQTSVIGGAAQKSAEICGGREVPGEDSDGEETPQRSPGPIKKDSAERPRRPDSRALLTRPAMRQSKKLISYQAVTECKTLIFLCFTPSIGIRVVLWVANRGTCTPVMHSAAPSGQNGL